MNINVFYSDVYLDFDLQFDTKLSLYIFVTFVDIKIEAHLNIIQGVHPFCVYEIFCHFQKKDLNHFRSI